MCMFRSAYLGQDGTLLYCPPLNDCIPGIGGKLTLRRLSVCIRVFVLGCVSVRCLHFRMTTFFIFFIVFNYILFEC